LDTWKEKTMIYTGERPTQDQKDQIESSRLRYHSILPFCSNKSIFDMGCGIGSGTHYLAQHTNQKVVGYDCCEEAIQEATNTFKLPNLYFSNTLLNYFMFEIISMIEFIEHLEHNEAIELLSTISKQSSYPILALTTPNGDVFPYHPANQSEYRGFHKWHFTYQELEFLKSIFEFVEIYAHMYDPTIQKFTSYTVIATNKKI
jgi:2-polyprenyl-3-methyl-5-hydroxy-6-metoxy-1,4-benzoquinol methylase